MPEPDGPDPARLGDAPEAGRVNGDASAGQLSAVVTGRVQGVGFRRYVRRWARTLGLTGWVRNEPDGSVRVVAQGDPAALDRLARLLWGGPPTADVGAVAVERAGPSADPDPDFRVER